MSKSKDQLNKKAAKQLRKKLKLEKKLARQMRGFFKRQNDLFEKLYEESGIVLDANATKQELEDILAKHYKKTAATFSSEVVDDMNRAIRSSGYDEVDNKHPEVALALLIFIGSNINASADFITNTSNKEIAFAVSKHGDDAAAATAYLRNRGINRANSIALTENQKAAEGAKFTASEALSTAVSAVTIGTALVIQKKTWISRRDGRVRPAHVMADGQERELSEPYFVMNEYLMYPGDTSLGATMPNIVHCRCVSVTEHNVASVMPLLIP